MAKLSKLTSLQTFGYHRSDRGVQWLAALSGLDDLWLEEESLPVGPIGPRDRSRHSTIGLVFRVR